MIIPALDLSGGHVVRLKQGDFAQKTVFNVDPNKKVFLMQQIKVLSLSISLI